MIGSFSQIIHSVQLYSIQLYSVQLHSIQQLYYSCTVYSCTVYNCTVKEIHDWLCQTLTLSGVQKNPWKLIFCPKTVGIEIITKFLDYILLAAPPWKNSRHRPWRNENRDIALHYKQMKMDTVDSSILDPNWSNVGECNFDRWILFLDSNTTSAWLTQPNLVYVRPLQWLGVAITEKGRQNESSLANLLLLKRNKIILLQQYVRVFSWNIKNL